MINGVKAPSAAGERRITHPGRRNFTVSSSASVVTRVPITCDSIRAGDHAAGATRGHHKAPSEHPRSGRLGQRQGRFGEREEHEKRTVTYPRLPRRRGHRCMQGQRQEDRLWNSEEGGYLRPCNARAP